MKNTMIPLLMGTVMCCLPLPLIAQSFKEHISKEFTLSEDPSSQTLFIYNINGFIKVEGYAGAKVLLEVDETISADDNITLETGKKEFRLGFEQKTDSIITYIAEPFDSRPHQHWNYNRPEINYRYQVDYTVKVPSTINLHISTVNDGMITIGNVNGVLNINNVNGAISVTNAKGTTNVRTVNGDIAINYLVNPPEQSSYNTINGNIDIRYQSDLSADLQFKSMHGDFFTDFPETEILPASASKKQENKNGQTIYKINKIPLVRYGKGGKVFKFETINGNVYIRKQS
jgi:DUF4097 and DUF4098 domain-containing protein YvlB